MATAVGLWKAFQIKVVSEIRERELYMLIKHRKSSDILGSEITSKTDFDNRRKFLKTAAFAGVGLAASTLPMPAFAARTPLANVQQTQWNEASLGDKDKISDYDDVTQYNNFYEFGTGKRDPRKMPRISKRHPWGNLRRRCLQQTGQDFLRRFDQTPYA